MDWSVNEQNGKLTVSVTHPADDRGLYRAYAVGPGGNRCLLGALTPNGPRLTLRRTLSADTLKQRGCYPIASVETVLFHSFSAAPTPPFPDDILRAAFACASGGRYQNTSDGFTLTFPYASDAPFPMLPIFCFAQVFRLDRRLWVRYAFDKEGNPQLPAHNPAKL